MSDEEKKPLVINEADYQKDNPRIVLDENNKIVLSSEQETAIINFWNNYQYDDAPSIDNLSDLIYGKTYDPRSKPYLAIRKFLKKQNFSLEKRKKEFELDPHQQEYVLNHMDNTSSLEMARQIFDNPTLTPLNRETVAVITFIKKIREKSGDNTTPAEAIVGNYLPPKQIIQAAARVNKYTFVDNITTNSWEKNSQTKNRLETLIKFCHHPRFVLITNSYINLVERDLFEGSYIAYVWDKIDLTIEELDLYIDICQDIVSEYRINREVDKYTEMLGETANDAEGKKISLSIGEHIKNLRDDVSKNKERRKRAIENLQGKRSERIDKRRQENDSLLYLVDFVKQSEKRAVLLKGLEMRKKQLEEEIVRLDNLPDLVFEIYGVGKEEILNRPIV